MTGPSTVFSIALVRHAEAQAGWQQGRPWPRPKTGLAGVMEVGVGWRRGKHAAARPPANFQELPSVDAHRYPSSRYGAPFGPVPLPEELPDQELQELPVDLFHDSLAAVASVLHRDSHFRRGRPVERDELAEDYQFPFEPGRGVPRDLELSDVVREIGRHRGEKPGRMIRVFLDPPGVRVHVVVRGADDPVDGGDEGDLLAPLDHGEGLVSPTV